MSQALMNSPLFLRRLHLWLGCLFAPLLIFFAITGAMQALALDGWLKKGERMENLSAPKRWAIEMSRGHTAHRSGMVRIEGKESEYRPFEWNSEDSRKFPYAALITIMAAGLIMTTALGVWMAFRFGGPAWIVSLLLGAGILVPFLLYQWRMGK